MSYEGKNRQAKGMKENKQNSSELVRWGIIGAGKVCEEKAGPPLYKLEDGELVLVHRRDREAGESFCRRHGHGRYEGDLEAFLFSDAIDAVYVASPHDVHAEHTIAALEAGKAVMVEKPMGMNTAECDAMVAAAERAGCALGVAYYRRGYPSVERLRKEMEDCSLGEVRRVSINNEFPTSHRLDLVHWLLGDVAEVQVLPGNENTHRFEATLERLELRMVSGVEVRMMSGWTETGIPEAIRVETTEGVWMLDDLKGGRLTRLRGEEVEMIECGGLPHTHWGLFANFNRHLLRGERLLCDGMAGRQSTVLMDALASVPRAREWFPVR